MPARAVEQRPLVPSSDAGWPVFVEQPLLRNRHHRLLPGNVSRTLRWVISDVKIAALERPELAGTTSSARRQIAVVDGRAKTTDGAAASTTSDLRLLRDLEGVIDFDAEIPHRRLELGVPKQQLHGAQVLGAPVDQRRLGPAHRVGAVVGTVQPKFIDSMPEDPGVLAGAQMR